MNYYNPNYYQSYPYGNSQYIPQYSQVPQQSISQGLNGKVVDSEDVVRATEVPIGGYGIFPKADLSEIYVKSWNNNGTTSVFTFKPSMPPEPVEETSNKDIQSLIEKISNLETKIDSLCGSQVKEEKPAAKKESVNF